MDRSAATLHGWPTPVSAVPPPFASSIERRRAAAADCSQNALIDGIAQDTKQRLYQDDYVLAIDKPVGLYCSSDLAHSLQTRLGFTFLRLVHRLDRDTSGILICSLLEGKSDTSLAKAFQGTEHARKEYIALCTLGRIDRPLLIHDEQHEMAIRSRRDQLLRGEEVLIRTGHGRSRHGLWRIYPLSDVGRKLPGQSVVREIQSIVRISRSSGPYWVLVIRPLTGRTHQIRLHLSHCLAAPIVGDVRYGGILSRFHHLHAFSLTIPHPEDPRSVLEIRSPLPSWALVSSPGVRRPTPDCPAHGSAMSESECAEAPLKVVVFGCGAVGTIIAGRLANLAKDVQVSVIARGKRLAFLQETGLRITCSEAKHCHTLSPQKCPAFGSEDLNRLDPPDVIFVTVKSTGIAACVPEIAPILGPNTLVIFVQNGIPFWYNSVHRDALPQLANDEETVSLVNSIGKHRIVGSIIYIQTTEKDNGEVEQIIVPKYSVGRLVFGMLEPSSSSQALLDRLSSALTTAGFTVGKSVSLTEFCKEIWTKLLGNIAFNCISALTGATMGECYHEFDPTKLDDDDQHSSEGSQQQIGETWRLVESMMTVVN